MKIYKIIILLFIHIYFCQFSSAQTWEKIVNDRITDIEEASSGGSLVSGFRPDLNTSSIKKYDHVGELVWTYTIEGVGEIIRGIYELEGGEVFFFVNFSGNDNYIGKLDVDGELLWINSDISTFSPNVNFGRIDDVKELGNGDLKILFGQASDRIVIQVDAQGDVISNTYTLLDYSSSFFAIYGNLTSDSGVVLYSEGSFVPPGGTASTTGKRISKFNEEGELEWEYYDESDRIDLLYSRDVIETADGGFAFAHSIRPYVEPDTTYNVVLTKLSTDGQLLWRQEYSDSSGNQAGVSVCERQEGGFSLTGLANSELFIMLTDSEGNFVKQEKYGGNFTDYGVGIERMLDGGFFVFGAYGITPGGIGNLPLNYLIRTDSLGRKASSFIGGRVAVDLENNCINDENETPVPFWIISASNTENTFYAVTDTLGEYLLEVEPGTYNLSLNLANEYWDICENNIEVESSVLYDTVFIDFQINPEIECPALSVDISTSLLRRCFNPIYYVNYCNQGTIPAENAYIEVTFEPYMTPTGITNLPWTSVAGQTYTYEIGDLAVHECGSFYIGINMSCEEGEGEVGEIGCVEAHIFPDILCPTLNSTWDGSNIIVNATCEEDSVRFFIENIGTGNMDNPQEYIIIEDHIIFIQEPYQLPAGEQIDIPIQTEGIAYRLETTQTPGHPIGNMPSVNIEGCNVEEVPDFLLGFSNSYPDDDVAGAISIDCQTIIASYDPNDKQAFPIGYGEEHFIEANIELEYLIRFQNTGTDTAFTVVIEDVLSEHLDITTIQAGASSHTYEFDIENGRKLKFTFNNILLPDSTTNEVASHGFIKFKVKQIADNPIGTRIENSAAIFFDFNAPVITNTVFHEIGENFIESIVVSTPEVPVDKKRVLVHPNPFSEETIFTVKGVENKIDFVLYDMQGREVRRELKQANSFKFLRKGLTKGLYFYQITVEGELLDVGKIVVQ